MSKDAAKAAADKAAKDAADSKSKGQTIANLQGKLATYNKQSANNPQVMAVQTSNVGSFKGLFGGVHMFAILLYLFLLSFFGVYYNEKACVIDKIGKSNINPTFWSLISFVFLVLCVFIYLIVNDKEAGKWSRFLIFIFHFIVFVFSILLYIFFKNERCDDKSQDIIGDTHASINVILDILMISSTIMMGGSLTNHFWTDCNC